MSSGSLLTIAALTLGLAAVYVWVGARLWRRANGSDERRALGLFCLFWVGIALYGIAESTWVLTYVAGLDDIPLAVTVLHVKIVTSTAAFFGLVAYLAYMLTGRTRIVLAIAVAYVVLFTAVETFYIWRAPIAQHATTWGLRLDYANPDPGLAWDVVLLLLFVPPTLSALAYASLLRVATDRETRWRIAWTSVSLLGFFAPTLLGWFNGSWAWWGLAEKMLSLALAGGVLIAFRSAPAPRRERARTSLPGPVAERIRDIV